MKKILSLFLSLLLIFSLCACGAQSASEAEFAPAEAPAMNEEMAFDGLAEAPEPALGGGSDIPEIDPEKIIYSAEITLETTEFEKSIEKLNELIAEYGGYVESSSKSDASFYAKAQGRPVFRDAQFTIRIPSDKFSAVNGDLSELGNVPYSHTYTENVSAQYYDTEARLKSYTLQEERLLEMLDVAESIEDILAIEGQLADVRYEIESLQSSLKNWDRRINYSTIYLSVQEVSEYTDSPAPSLSYGERLWRALKNGLFGVGDFFRDLLLWFVGALPALVLITAVVLILRPVFKKLRTKRRLKKEQKSKDNK